MKRTILFFTILLSSIGAFAYDISAVSPSGQTLYYNITGGNAVVTYQNSGSPRYSNLTGALVIPASVTYNGTTYSVTSIGTYAFFNCSGLTSVTIGNSVTSIGDETFFGCSGLTSVTIGNSVTSIGGKAFKNCSGLTSITIPNSVTSIADWAFYNCSGLTSVTIPNSVTTIGEGAFYGCSGLTSVTIPNSVTTIGDYAFYFCGGLTSVTIPNSVTSIGVSAFDFCDGLTSVTIGNSVTSIGDYAFRYCSGLTSVTIPNSVTSIGDYVFYNCSGLTSLTIPNSVTSIGYGTFAGCTGLTSVTIGNSVTTIGNSAFCGCSSLTEITSEARTAPWLECPYEYNVFSGVDRQIPVKIPCGSLASYMSSLWSSYFSNFVQDGEGFSFEATSNNPAMGYVTVLTQPTCSDPHAVVKAVANPGYRFVRWDNGVTNNPYELDLISDTTLVAIFESASTQGVDDVVMNSCNITTRDGMIVVKGAEGELLRIFDIEGRVIVSERVEEGKQYSMPHSGVYMVQVGNTPAQKVVVVR